MIGVHGRRAHSSEFPWVSIIGYSVVSARGKNSGVNNGGVGG